MSDHYETRCPSCGGSDEQGCYADCPTTVMSTLRAEVASKNEQFQQYARKMELDMNDLGAENARLTARIRELEGALGFYANPANRRDGRFEHQVDPDNGHNVLVSIPSSYIKDGGKRATAALKGKTNDRT